MQNNLVTKEWILVAFILLLTFLVFSPALKSGFVNWDDPEQITLNQNVHDLTVANIKNIFSKPVIGGYTPLTSLSFAVEIKFFGMKPGVFHFNNIILHLLCTMLVFILMRKMGMNLFISFMVSLLFGIHPMRVESVAWITERKDVLYGSFYLLSLILYINYYTTKRSAFYFLALAAFVFALLSKIQAVTLPLAMLLIDYYFEKKFRFRQVWNKIPYLVLSLATGLAGFHILAESGTLETGTVLPFFQRIFIGTYALCVYLVKSLVPYQLSAIYPYPEKLSVLFYASPAVVVLLAVLIYRSGKYRNDLVFGTLFFLSNVIFMLQIVGAGQAFMADRFTYIAYIGLFFILARAVNILYESRRKAFVLATLAIYLAVLGSVSWSRTRVWKNTETLFSDVIEKFPEVAFAHNNLGFYYRDQNENEKAIEAYSKAIGIKPEGHISYSNRGEAWFDQGETDKALADLNMAIKLKPDYSQALSNRGAVWGSKKEFSLALADLNKAISLDSKNLRAYINRSLVYYEQGNFEKAILDITYYLSVKPDNPDMLNLRALCFGRINKNKEALADFTSAIQLNPRAGAYFQNRSYLLYKLGKPADALKDILKAQELGAKVDLDYIKILSFNKAIR